MEGYDHKKIEKKWRDVWKKGDVYKTADSVKGKDNFYLLTEFPYPSGNLHVGHWYAFALPDILARYFRMRGKNVVFPMGFDAFGLPAENAAIKNKLNPRAWTEKNIEYMKQQIESMGASFDWSREVQTIDPQYYKWTQWQFLQFFKNGLVYQKETAVNWCPKDKTVLANEQVVDGKCERCDSIVEQKMMLQWNIKITDYADRLIDDLEPLDWPQEIKESQKNWIGRSEGAEIDFGLDLGEKKKYVILHGYKSRGDRPRHQWYAEKLRELGHEVLIPQLPNPDEPIEEEQVAAALEATEYDENTVLVGHSLGGVVAMKVLQKLDKKIAGLVLIAPAIDPKFHTAEERPFWKTFKWDDLDYKKIISLTKFRFVFSDLQEKNRIEYLRYLSPQLEARLVETNAVKEHFTGDTEPDVLMWLRPTIRVFTTRADTLYGATYLVLSPEHQWVKLALGHKTVLKNNDEVQKYVEQAKNKSDLERQMDQKEKTGVRLEGVDAINPATGGKIPVYVADYVLATYGTGAIMAVPAHDERDHEFAKKFKIPIEHVVAPVRVDEKNPPVTGQKSVYRKLVMALVRNSKTGKYLALKRKDNEWTTFVIGGVEGNEDAEKAARREIEEESGYTNLTFVRSLGGPIYSEFNASHKGENRVAHNHVLLFELNDETQKPLAPEEASKHEVIWIDHSEITRARMAHGELDLVLQRLDSDTDIYDGEGKLINSGEFDGADSEEARTKITEKFGRKRITYKLRDWIVSRQRYWGVPIPIIHCEKCGSQPVPDKDLPVELPDVEDYLPSGEGKSPLAKVDSFVNVKCPTCDRSARRETDTLDTFVDSSWYFLRYTDPENAEAFAARDKQDHWMPVDLYSGGAEHTTMHLLYSRFWHKALYDLGLVAEPEPYKKRMNRSLIMGPDGQKMSKSRGNVIDPDEVVERLGADTVRMYLAFIGPYNEVSNYPWNPDGVVGVRRFIERVFRLHDAVQKDDIPELNVPLHRTIKKVGEDVEVLKFNTAISQLMIFLNDAEKQNDKKAGIGDQQWRIFLRLLAPFAPFVAEELWSRSGHKTSLFEENWPIYDEGQLRDAKITIAVQVNGKTRGQTQISSDADREKTEELAREVVAKRILGQKVEKTIVIPSRLVNFVLEDKSI
jgi:leucyl-tRNA synthetase